MIKHRNIRISSAPGLAAIGLAAGLALAPLPAAALTITTVTTGDAAAQLIPPLLATGSGITVVPGTSTYQGSLAAGQSGTYTGFNLVPGSGSGPTLSLPNGIVLTSGTANLPLTNTVNQFNPVFPGTGSNALLSTLTGNSTNDANALGFSFTVPDMLKYKTLITQEMLKKGYLAATSIYSCTEHTQPLVDQYFEALDPLFALIKECEMGRSVDALLEGPVCHSGFKRLN